MCVPPASRPCSERKHDRACICSCRDRDEFPRISRRAAATCVAAAHPSKNLLPRAAFRNRRERAVIPRWCGGVSLPDSRSPCRPCPEDPRSDDGFRESLAQAMPCFRTSLLLLRDILEQSVDQDVSQRSRLSACGTSDAHCPTCDHDSGRDLQRYPQRHGAVVARGAVGRCCYVSAGCQRRAADDRRGWVEIAKRQARTIEWNHLPPSRSRSRHESAAAGGRSTQGRSPARLR
jgi:hypothetical protein